MKKDQQKFPIGDRIKAARDAAGLTQGDLAKIIGMTQQGVQSLEAGVVKRPRKLKEIAEATNTSQDYLLSGDNEDRIRPNVPLFTTRQNSTGTANDIPQNAAKGGGVSITRKIPAFGQAMGGKNGAFVLNGNKIADVLAPPSLDGVPDAYAVLVVGDSMEPRYFAGEAVFVNPKLPVRKYDFVVVQIASVEGDPPLGYVKRFISKDDRRIRLEQFNPKKNLEFPSNKVVSVHRIIMGGDG